MENEHIIKGKIVHKIGQEFYTLKTMGNEKKNEPFIIVQKNNNGQGKVIVNPEVIGLDIRKFKEIFSNLKTLNKKRDYDDRYSEISTYFIEHHNGKNYHVAFHKLDHSLKAINIWGSDLSKEAKFVDIKKAEAFADFIYINIVKSTLFFKEDLKDIFTHIENNFNINQTSKLIDKQNLLLKLKINNSNNINNNRNKNSI